MAIQLFLEVTMTRKQKKNLKRIIIALCLFAVVMVLDLCLKHTTDNYPNGIASLIDGKYGWLLSFSLYFLIN